MEEEDKKELLLFQMGPVQEFIAQARSTRDLWSGSYLLSWLVAHAIVAAWKAEGGNVTFNDMVMPSIRKEDNPLLFALMDKRSLMDDDQVRKALIPNLPNRFAMLVPAGTGKARAEAASSAVRDELQNIGEAVWKWLEVYGAKPEWKRRFDSQLAAFPQITWAVHARKDGEPFEMAWDSVNDALAARRNTRDFAQWDPVCKDAAVKDSLSGREECIGDEEFWSTLKRDNLFSKATGHRYGAMNLVKRLWCHVDDAESGKNFLANSLVFRERQIKTSLLVPDLPSVAQKNTDSKVPYVAVVAFDGDRMGTTIDGRKSSPDGIRKISAALSEFALEKVPGIVERHAGHLVYAGGDDVLAILPSSKAVACAREIREAFHGMEGFDLDGSCGIAVGHFKAPLQMLVKQAQHMESVAKNRYGRSALAIAVYKRSGEILEWGCKWSSPSLSLMNEVTRLSSGDRPKLSSRFPYALAALLKPYELGKMKPEELSGFEDVIRNEVAHVLERQGSNLSADEREKFAAQIDEHFDAVAAGVDQPETRVVGRELTDAEKKGEHKVHPDDFLGLFLVETFLNRKREGR